MTMTPETIGSGVSAGVSKTATGRLRRVADETDVLDILDSGPDGVIVLVEDAGATFLAPIHLDLSGVLCRSGGLDSHIAIVSRSVDIPTLINVVFAGPEPSDGDLVRLDPAAGLVERVGS